MEVEKWEEALIRKEKVCKNCTYHSTLSGYIVCDYIEITHKRRPCPGSLCVEQGVFQPIPGRKCKFRTWKKPEKAETTVVKPKKEDKPDTPKTKTQLYYEAHKEEIKTKVKEYKEKHPERVAEYKRRWREKKKAREA